RAWGLRQFQGGRARGKDRRGRRIALVLVFVLLLLLLLFRLLLLVRLLVLLRLLLLILGGRSPVLEDLGAQRLGAVAVVQTERLAVVAGEDDAVVPLVANLDVPVADVQSGQLCAAGAVQHNEPAQPVGGVNEDIVTGEETVGVPVLPALAARVAIEPVE